MNAQMNIAGIQATMMEFEKQVGLPLHVSDLTIAVRNHGHEARDHG